MAKKKSAKRKTGKVSAAPDLSLPQNIQLIGESAQEEKRVYIAQDVYKEIHRFSANKTTVESGGVLLGNVVEEFGKTHIVVRAFVEAKFSEATNTKLTFTHKTWDYIHKVAGERYSSYKIIGWIHTHPNFGIFLSEYDKFIHQNFYSEENQIAYVIDPIRNEEGFYYWKNRELERCGGFYVFDKTGRQIELEGEDDGEEAEAGGGGASPFLKVLVGVMGVLLVGLALYCFSLSARLNAIQTRQQELERSYEELAVASNNNFLLISQKFEAMDQAISGLDARVTALEPQVPEESVEETTNENTGEEGETKDGE